VCVCKEFASSEHSLSGTLTVFFQGGNVQSIAFIYIVMLLSYCLDVVVSLVAP
jgi:hypothetical protein